MQIVYQSNERLVPSGESLEMEQSPYPGTAHSFSASQSSVSSKSRTEQVIQQFYAKVAQVIISSRCQSSSASDDSNAASKKTISPANSITRRNLGEVPSLQSTNPKNLSRNPSQLSLSRANRLSISKSSQSKPVKVNKWFNLQLEDNEQLKEDLRYWRINCISQQPPPPLTIDIFLDISELNQKYKLLLKDDLGRKQRISKDELEYYDENGELLLKKSILLETWQLNLSYPVPTNPPELAVLYKKAVIFFRSLFSHVRLLPAYRLYRLIQKRNLGSEMLKIGYRLSSNRVSPVDQVGLDQLHLGNEMRISEFAFQTIDTSFGVFSLHVAYRMEVEFSLESAETVFSSKFLDMDENFFSPRPAIIEPPNTTSKAQSGSSNISSLSNVQPQNIETRHSFQRNYTPIPSPSTTPYQYFLASLKSPLTENSRSNPGSITSLNDRRRSSYTQNALTRSSSVAASPQNFFMPIPTGSPLSFRERGFNSDSNPGSYIHPEDYLTRDNIHEITTILEGQPYTKDMQTVISSTPNKRPNSISSLRGLTMTKNAAAVAVKTGRINSEFESGSDLDVIFGSSPPFSIFSHASPARSIKSYEALTTDSTTNITIGANVGRQSTEVSEGSNKSGIFDSGSLNVAEGFEFPAFANLESNTNTQERTSITSSVDHNEEESSLPRSSNVKATLNRFQKLKDLNSSFSEMLMHQSALVQSQESLRMQGNFTAESRTGENTSKARLGMETEEEDVFNMSGILDNI